MTQQAITTVMISAGEASGDMHAASVSRELRKLHPNIHLFGMGSDKLQEAGVELLLDCRDIAVMGLIEVLRHWGEITRALNTLKRAIDERKPDVLLLIDYVEFNLKLAAYAKSKGVKVLFYVSPQVWAWRSGRVPKIGRAIDKMAVIFPFETTIYEQHNIPVEFVGHPLVDKVSTTCSVLETRERLGFSSDDTVLALLPGSRRGEIERILPIMFNTVRKLSAERPQMKFVLVAAPTLDAQHLQSLIDTEETEIKLITEHTYNIINSCNAVLVASGTATLEVALLGKPMSVLYRVNSLTYQIFRRLIKIDNIALVNIVSGKRVVPEFIQADATADVIAPEVIHQLDDAQYRTDMIAALDDVREKLGEGGCSEKVARLILSM